LLRRLAQTVLTAGTQVPTHRNGLWLAAFAATTCHDYTVAYDREAPAAERRADFEARLAAIPANAYRPFTARAWLSAVRESGDTCLRWPAGPPPDVPTRASYTTSPVLVLAGDLDTNTPLRAAREAAAHFPSAVLVRVPNVGHTPLTGDPTGCTAAIAASFVQRLRPGATACLRRIPPPRVR
jgi:pimeloyl-ACP methyl ester carboxylesterase